MHRLGEGFGEAVGERLDEDRGIIVIGPREALGDRLFLDAGRDDEAADIVGLAAVDAARRNRPARHWRVPSRLDSCWRSVKKVASFVAARLVGEQTDVVADGVGRPEADHRLRREPFLGDDLASASPARRRTIAAPRRPASRPREWRDSGPSAPRSGRTASSRCSGRARPDRRSRTRACRGSSASVGA